MILYHFTAEHLLPSIMAQGLSRGALPTANNKGELLLITGYQWLTDDPQHDTQSWATRNFVPYDRSAVRLTIAIPVTHEKYLLRWVDHARKLSRISHILNRYGNPGSWWIYDGTIPPSWIDSVDRRPQEQLAQAHG